MEFFVDTAEIKEIATGLEWGMVDGVTTNPSLIAKTGRPYLPTVAEIARLVGEERPVSGEVLATEVEGMLAQGRRLAALAPNVVVKVPLTVEGLRATRQLAAEGIKTNVTLCFSSNQALLAAKAGATFVSPFIGRVDDIGWDGMALIGEMRRIFDNYGFKTQILAASIRTVNHVKDAALIGADVATIPPSTMRQLVKHTLTDKGLESFMADWAKTGQTIA